MNSVFNILEVNRRLYLKYLNGYSLDQLNNIPNGFNNNLIWNIGHIVVVQQALIYKSSGLEGYITSDMFNTYKPGTKPIKNIQEKEILELKILLLSLIQQTRTDYSRQLFSNLKPRKTSTGFQLNTIEDVMVFNNYHEAMHFGIMKSISKFI